MYDAWQLQLNVSSQVARDMYVPRKPAPTRTTLRVADSGLPELARCRRDMAERDGPAAASMLALGRNMPARCNVVLFSARLNNCSVATLAGHKQVHMAD